ncbi:MAG TPA: integrase core domain-containing protein [Streptosporangiaceae bacterium]|nr:integrase core domain-containing protein [Streptosporangiaceae bacterium]
MTQRSPLKVSPRYRWRVQQRITVLAYARDHGMAAAGRHYGVSAKTVRRWRDRWQAGGVPGLVPRYPRRRAGRIRPELVPLIEHARKELGDGAARTRLWLQRVHQARLAMGTIQRVFRDLGVPRLRRTRKRLPRQLKLFERPDPGDCVQVDVKFVRLGGRWAFQYTALDDCTRYRVLRLYPRLGPAASFAFLAELRRAFPFPIRRLQCDNGREFPLAFAMAVEAAGIRHRYIQPRRPQQNGKVERSHRIDHEEFWSRHTFPDFDAAATALRGWERTYNHDRFSLAIQGRTPAEKLGALLPPSHAA